MIRITIDIERPMGQAIGIKEDLAMYLERWGDCRVINVTDRPEEQMEIKAAPAEPEEVKAEEKPKETKAKAKRFRPPTAEEVRAYCAERENDIDPEAFVDFYASKGWTVGRSPMRDWKAAVRTWEKDENRRGRAKAPATIQNSDRVRAEDAENIRRLMRGIMGAAK